MTKRATLPKAALAAVREAQDAAGEAARILRGLLRAQPHTTDLAAALSHLARAETRLGEARGVGKGGSMEGKRQARQVPSVGRAVHYKAYGTPGGEFPAGVCRAATITEVDDPGNLESAVGLAVLNPTGLFFNQHIPYGDGPGQWHWPEFVPPA